MNAAVCSSLNVNDAIVSLELRDLDWSTKFKKRLVESDLKNIEHVLFLSTSKATVEFDADCFQSGVHTRQSGLFDQIIAFDVRRKLNSVNAPLPALRK